MSLWRKLNCPKGNSRLWCHADLISAEQEYYLTVGLWILLLKSLPQACYPRRQVAHITLQGPVSTQISHLS